MWAGPVNRWITKEAPDFDPPYLEAGEVIGAAIMARSTGIQRGSNAFLMISPGTWDGSLKRGAVPGRAGPG
jgi:hypothetical protein